MLDSNVFSHTSVDTYQKRKKSHTSVDAWSKWHGQHLCKGWSYCLLALKNYSFMGQEVCLANSGMLNILISVAIAMLLVLFGIGSLRPLGCSGLCLGQWLIFCIAGGMV